MPLLIRSALGAALLLSALPVLAETSPASGTATMANTEAMPLTYTSGPNTAVSANADNAAPCDDLVNPCDEFALTVNLPANFGSTNPNDQLVIRIEWTSMANDYDLVVYNAAGEEADTSGGTATTFEEVRLPAQAGINTYTIRTNFFAVADEAYTGLVFIATPDAGGGPGALPIAMPGTFDAPRFHVHRSPQGRGVRAAEPTLFKNWLSDNTMYIAVLETLRVSFDDSVSPAASTWSLHSPVNGVVQSLDPILWGDEITGRTLSSQLTGANSLLSFSDDDGESWTPAQIGPPNGGADHQSIGGGPYGPDTLPGFPTPLYPNAIYYCSQSIAAAFCARSDDGGLTFGAGVPLYPITQCFGLHGHVKVGPDGTVFVPNKSCLDETGVTLLMDGKPAVVVSSDSGVTWDVRTVPDAVGGGGVDDPSVAIAMMARPFIWLISKKARASRTWR